MTIQQSAPARTVEPPVSRAPRAPFLWLLWRQHGGLVVWSAVATALLCTGLLLAQSALATTHCVGSAYDLTVTQVPDSCGIAAAQNGTLYGWSLWLLQIAVFAPVLVGALWGAPLVARELEHGTATLAWGQGMSARRWLCGKTAAFGLLAVVLDVPLWLCARLVAGSLARLAPGEVGGRFGWQPFATLAPMVVPYSIAALCVGVLCGALWRKTLPAVFLAIALCAGLGVGTADFVRPHYVKPVTVRLPVSSVETDPTQTQNPLYLEPYGWLDRQGLPVKEFPQSCATNDADCLAADGIFSRVVVYQPGSREAAFQWIEAALCLILAGGCVTVSAWRVRPR